MRKSLATLAAIMIATLGIAACSDADIGIRNLSKAADNFEVNRRIVFYNGITGDYILSIEGQCSKGNSDSISSVTITCKTGEGAYKKHFLGISDNVTYFIEQARPLARGCEPLRGQLQAIGYLAGRAASPVEPPEDSP